MAPASSRDGSAGPGANNHRHTPVGSLAPTTVDDHPISRIPHILPHERVFPIQIGGELFKLSGASLSSDGASRIDTEMFGQG